MVNYEIIDIKFYGILYYLVPWFKTRYFVQDRSFSEQLSGHNKAYRKVNNLQRFL